MADDQIMNMIDTLMTLSYQKNHVSASQSQVTIPNSEAVSDETFSQYTMLQTSGASLDSDE